MSISIGSINMFPGFNNRKRGSISSGDWDRDGVRNLRDCNAMDWRKQGPAHEGRRVPTQQSVYDRLRSQGHDDEVIDMYMDEEFNDKDTLAQQKKKMKRWFN